MNEITKKLADAFKSVKEQYKERYGEEFDPLEAGQCVIQFKDCICIFELTDDGELKTNITPIMPFDCSDVAIGYSEDDK